ncbi:MAG: DUF1993 domain-containing protein [Gammaproteobacteria bacterium]
MSISMYQNSIPFLVRSLQNLAGVLKKGASYSEEKGFDEKVMTGYRLFPNMFPLTRQVQIACDMAKGAGARLAGVDVPSFADEEVTFDELQTRIARTIEFLETLKPDQFEGSETRQITIKAGDREFSFTGLEYLHGWVIPNLYFHATTTYNILRHVGVEVGKADFLGAS